MDIHEYKELLSKCLKNVKKKQQQQQQNPLLITLGKCFQYF